MRLDHLLSRERLGLWSWVEGGSWIAGALGGRLVVRSGWEDDETEVGRWKSKRGSLRAKV